MKIFTFLLQLYITSTQEISGEILILKRLAEIAFVYYQKSAIAAKVMYCLLFYLQ